MQRRRARAAAIAAEKKAEKRRRRKEKKARKLAAEREAKEAAERAVIEAREAEWRTKVEAEAKARAFPGERSKLIAKWLRRGLPSNVVNAWRCYECGLTNNLEARFCAYCHKGYPSGIVGIIIMYDHLPDLTLRGPPGGIHAVRLSPAGGELATGSTDAAVRVWSARDGQLRWTSDRAEDRKEWHGDWVTSLDFSGDGRQIVSGCLDGGCRLWNNNAYRQKGLRFTRAYGGRLATGVTAVSFSARGDQVASACKDGALRLYRRIDGEPQGEARVKTGGQLLSVAYSPGGSKIIAGTGWGELYVFNAKTLEVEAVLSEPDDYIAEQERVAAFRTHEREAYERKRAEALRQELAKREAARAARRAARRAERERLAEERRRKEAEEAEKRRKAEAKKKKKRGWMGRFRRNKKNQDPKPVPALDLAAAEAASNSEPGDDSPSDPEGGDGDAKATGEPPHGPLRVHAVAFSRDGRRFASTGSRGRINIWKTVTGERKAILRGHRDVVTALCYSPDGCHLASGSRDGTVVVWCLHNGLPSWVMSQHSGQVLSVDFSRDGTRIASGSQDSCARITSFICQDCIGRGPPPDSDDEPEEDSNRVKYYTAWSKAGTGPV